MGKPVTRSSCSRQGTRRSLRIKLIQNKHIQLNRDLSKRVQPLRGEIKSLKRQRRRPTRAQSRSGDYKQVQSQMKKSKCMHPKRGKLIQPQCSIPKRVQPKRGKLAQSTHGKPLGVKPQSGKPKAVKPQLRIPKCVHSQRPTFIKQQRGNLIQRRRRHPKCKEKQLKPTQQLPETREQPNVDTPVSLRMQIKMAVKNSQKITPAEVTLPNKRYNKCMDVKGTGRKHLDSSSLKGKHAKVNLSCQDGWTALHDACLNGHEKVVKALLKDGAEVNVQHPNGETPLFGAVTADNSKIVKLLIKHGANSLLKNDESLEVSRFAKSAFKEYLQNLKDKAYHMSSPVNSKERLQSLMWHFGSLREALEQISREGAKKRSFRKKRDKAYHMSSPVNSKERLQSLMWHFGSIRAALEEISRKGAKKCSFRKKRGKK